MRILLIQPRKSQLTIGGEDVFMYEPLALEYIAAGVAADHDVRILDMRIDEGLDDVLHAFQPEIIGLTAYTVHVNVVRKLAQKIKEALPGALVVVGGHHATVAPEDFLSPSVDVIVMGEGVSAFREIVQRSEKRAAFDDVAGIVLSQNGKLFYTEPRPLVELDALPFPDRTLTANYRRHYYSEWMRPLASMRTSKGCAYRCNFCALWKLTQGKYLRRDPAKIVEELRTIQEEFVFFADDESLMDAKRMTALAEQIRASGIKKRYFLYSRADTIARSPELLRVWRDIGLERIFVGFEFFREEDLAFVQKGSHLADNEMAAKILGDLGIEVYASFIVRPEFTKSEFAYFGPYCERLGLNFATFAVLTPLPGTDLYAKVRDQLILTNYDCFDFIHTLLPTKLPLRDFYEELYQLYKRAIPFRKQLPLLRKYPWKEIPGIFATSHRVLKQLRNAYLDYGAEVAG